MATVTAAINGQSVGTSTNVGDGLFGYKLTKQAASTTFLIAASLTNGAGAVDPRGEIVITYASSPQSLSTAQALAQLRTLKHLHVKPSPTPGGIVEYSTELETMKGDYVYLWANVPAMTVAGTLTVRTVELP